MSAVATEVPLRREQVLAVVEPHLEALADVMTQAWDGFVLTRDRSRAEMAHASASARGMLISDFIREPAHRRFQGLPGLRVDDRYGRPWVNCDGDRVQIRFKKLTQSLAICPANTERQTRLAFHLGDPVLPGMPEATILTAGYVLDAAEQQIERMALVCHIDSQVHYSIPLPGGASSAHVLTQLPLTPLSPPIIRSARAAAQERLRGRGDRA